MKQRVLSTFGLCTRQHQLIRETIFKLYKCRDHLNAMMKQTASDSLSETRHVCHLLKLSSVQ